MIVVIPTANNPVDLAVLLSQLQQQTVRPSRIFLADNSEKGYGIDIVRRYQWSVPMYVNPKAGAIYESWNKGIQFAQGDDVVILNDDIQIPEDFIERIQRGFDDGHFCLCPGNGGTPPSSQISEGYEWRKQGRYQSYHMQIESQHSHLPLVKGWCFALHADLIDNIGLFDEQFTIWYGDTDYSRRILKSGFKHIFINELHVHHYGTSSYSKIDKKIFNPTNFQDQVKYELKYSVPHQDLGWDQYA